MRTNIILAFVTLLFMISCAEEPEIIPPYVPPADLGEGFYVVNQGIYTSGNASLSFYSKDSAKMFNNIFFSRNDIPLGDVAQSITFNGDIAYVVVNNSGVIWIINASTSAIIAKLSNLYSPRYVCVVSPDKIYVSDFELPGISVFRAQDMLPLGTILTGKNTERMQLVGNKVFVANWSQYNRVAPNNTIQIINTQNDQLIDSVIVVKEPNSLVVDKNNKLWVLCSGGFMNEEIPALFKINSINHAIEARFDFPTATISPEQLVINASGDTLYYLNNGIFRMAITDSELPNQAFIPKGMRNYYALAVNPENSEIIATDAGNYVQSGYLFRFLANGTLIDSLKVGINPGFIGFK
ncbi:MAG: hypothetical protein Q8T08_21845 [Ignavibacteria bacterium]|nr:hypothetical protein [Ignavibacteria bacterium]